MAKKSLDREGRAPAAATRCAAYTRCNRCGRPRAVFRKFGLCRICLRELAHQGVIPGMTKSQLVGDDDADRSDRRHAHAHPQRQQGAARDTSRCRPRKLKVEIARLLKEEGYIKRLPRREAATTLRRRSSIELKYGRNRERIITDLKRVSKPGRRVYARKDRLPRVLGGMGTAILSTSQRRR